MSKQWARQEAKKNELAEAFEKVWTWAQSNQQQVLGVAGAIVVIALLGGYFAYQHWAAERAAWRSLAMAQGYAYRGQTDSALASLKATSAAHSRTPAWGFGLLLEGDIYYHQGQFQQAEAAYQKILERHYPEALLPFALSDLGQTQEASRDFQHAVETDRQFLDLYKDHYLAPQMHASLARSLEALGRKAEATTMYQQMTTLYPDDAYWSQWAQSRLKLTP